MSSEVSALTANEAACVTKVPLKQVHRIIDSGLLGDTVRTKQGARVISKHALIGLKLAHEMTGLLTLDSRRQLVRHVLDDPEVRIIRRDAVSIHLHPMKNDVKRGVTSLEKAKKMIATDKGILGGTPCFKGTRIPVHDIAEMLVNEDDVAVVLAAYPRLKERQVTAAATYAEAYPRRGRPRQQPALRKAGRRALEEVEQDK